MSLQRSMIQMLVTRTRPFFKENIQLLTSIMRILSMNGHVAKLIFDVLSCQLADGYGNIAYVEVLSNKSQSVSSASDAKRNWTLL